MNESPRPSSTLRNLSVYAQVSLAMVAGVYLLWAFIGGIDAQIAMLLDPSLQAQVEEAARAHQGSEEWVVEVLKIVAPRMHWPAVALVASLLAFPLLGWLLGRYAEDPSWAGILPMVDLLSGLNPIMLGQQDLIPVLPVHQQFGILLVQILCIHLTAHRVHVRRRALTPPPPPETPEP